MTLWQYIVRAEHRGHKPDVATRKPFLRENSTVYEIDDMIISSCTYYMCSVGLGFFKKAVLHRFVRK